MIDDDATQFSYFRDNELTQLAEMTLEESSEEKYKALEEGTLFLNKYKVLKVLGEGSFSLIYLLEANDASKKLLVAKEFFPKGFVTRNSKNEVILKTSLSDKEIENYQFMKDIFIGEAKNLVKVSSRTHPNILNFFSLEENVNNTMYLITDYEEGVTLKDYLKERKKEYKGKLTNQEVVRLLQGLLSGFEHMHNVKIYHQDIKLENILIRNDHTPLILDFGASIILYDEKRKKYFNATTPRYAAPEQIELSQPPAIDQRTDIYALGVLAYKLVTDTFPPKAEERLKALDEGHEDPYTPLEIQKIYGYEITLLKAIDKALKLLPEERFQNAKEFNNALLKKNIANVSYYSPKLLLGAILGFMTLFIYLFWPASQGTAKLNLKEKTYFVYSDGVKVPVSEEKTILLPTGKHQLTVIKDNYIPCEINTTIEENKITNIEAELIPSSHVIEFSSNIHNATFIVNDKRVKNNLFKGHYGEKYTIKTIALNHPSETVNTDYTILSHNDFRFYQKLKLKNQTVKLIIKKPYSIGTTDIKVNGKALVTNIFDAEESKKYLIDIVNPYFKVIHLEKTYKELVRAPVLRVILEQGKGKVEIEGLKEGVKIEAYQRIDNNNTKIHTNIKYEDHKYFIEMSSNEKLYFIFSKKGYISKQTPLFSLENNKVLKTQYSLSKKPIKHKIVTPKIETKKTTMEQKKQISVKEVKKDINKEVRKPLKKDVKKKKKDSIKKKKVNTKKRKKKKEKNSYRKTTSATWYCLSSGGASATASSRSSAAQLALKRCRKTKIMCHISSCYIWN